MSANPEPRKSRSGRIIKPNSLLNFNPDVTYEKSKIQEEMEEMEEKIEPMLSQMEIEVPSFRLLDEKDMSLYTDPEPDMIVESEMSDAAFEKRHRKLELEEKRTVKKYAQQVNERLRLNRLKTRLAEKEDRRLEKLRRRSSGRRRTKSHEDPEPIGPRVPRLNDIVAIYVGDLPENAFEYEIGPEVILEGPLPDPDTLE